LRSALSAVSESLSPKTVENTSNDEQIHGTSATNSSQNADGMQGNVADAPPITMVHQIAPNLADNNHLHGSNESSRSTSNLA
jgi:hypothetical protein